MKRFKLILTIFTVLLLCCNILKCQLIEIQLFDSVDSYPNKGVPLFYDIEDYHLNGETGRVIPFITLKISNSADVVMHFESPYAFQYFYKNRIVIRSGHPRKHYSKMYWYESKEFHHYLGNLKKVKPKGKLKFDPFSNNNSQLFGENDYSMFSRMLISYDKFYHGLILLKDNIVYSGKRHVVPPNSVTTLTFSLLPFVLDRNYKMLILEINKETLQPLFRNTEEPISMENAIIKIDLNKYRGYRFY